MGTNENVKKNSKVLKATIILSLVITLIALVGYAYAKYISSQNGDAEAQIAKWSFKVVDGDSSTIDVLDFPVTRTDNNNEVDRSTIAPGTYGKFEIDIDARGTETILTYEINIGFTNKPTNMKFYSDEAMTNEITLSNGRLIRTGFLSLSDVNYIQPQVIYWNWPLETGSTAEEIAQNDIIDSDFIGKTLTMAITVTGTQAADYASAENVASVTPQGGTATNYQTVQEAITVAKSSSGSTITLLKDRAIDGMTIAQGEDVTLDLNGKTLFLNNSLTNNGTLTITGAGRLTCNTASTIINNGSLIKTGIGTISNTAGISSDLNAIVNNSTVEVNNGTVTSSSGNTIVNNAENSTIIVTSTGVVSNTAVDANSTDVEGKYTLSSITSGSSINITGGTVTSNYRAIYLLSTANLNMSNGRVETTSKNTNSVAIAPGGNSTVTITGGTVDTDAAYRAIYGATKGTVTIGTSGDNSISNPSLEAGVYLTSASSNLYVYSGKIEANEKQGIVLKGNATISGGKVCNNAESSGYQPIWIAGNKTLTVTGGDLLSVGSGAVIGIDNNYKPTINITGGTLTGNGSGSGIGVSTKTTEEEVVPIINIGGTTSITTNGTCVNVGSSNGPSASPNITISGGTLTSTENRGVKNLTGTTTVYGNTTINVKMSVLYTSTGTINVRATENSNTADNSIGPVLYTSGTNVHAIYVSSTGTVNIGVNEATPSVNQSVPSITSEYKGVSVESGTCNFYDGIIKGKSVAFSATIPNTPTGYTTSPETADAQGYKTVTLVSE